MRIKNTLLLLTLLALSVFSFTGNVLANETSEVEDIILEALNGDEELKVEVEEKVKKELYNLSSEELETLIDNLNDNEELSTEEVVILKLAEESLENNNVEKANIDSSSINSIIKENLSDDEIVQNELESMTDDAREKLYNNLKEKDSLSDEEEITLEILEKEYAVDTWINPTIILAFVVVIVTLISSVAETYKVPLLL